MTRKLSTILLLVAALAALSGSLCAQTTIYVDSLYTGGGNNGTSTNPFTSIATAMSTVNTDLASANVTVYISACNPTCTAEQATDGFSSSQRTDGSSHILTLDGMSKFQTNASHGTAGGATWSTNFVPPAPPNYPGYQYAKTLLNGSTSTVNTSGAIVTWVSGDAFNTQWSSRAGTVNGSGVTITSCSSETTCTLSASVGTLTGVSFTAAPILKAQMTGSVPLGSTDSFSNCKGFFVYHGLDVANNNGQTADLTYIHDMTLEYSELHRIGLGAGGPTVYIGPGQHGPCHTGAARPGGTDSGPDNVIVQYNYIHEGWGESIYSGASTSDPFVAAGCTSCQQFEAGTSGDNLSCGNGCASNSTVCTTAVAANAATCSTGAHYRIIGNTIESGAAWGGQGDGMDIKDGHSDLQIVGNSVWSTKPPACSPTCTNTACYNGEQYTLSAAGNASAGSTVYTGTFADGGTNGLASVVFSISGFTTGANNGTFTVSASTTTTITVNNASGVAETHAATANNDAVACTARSQCTPNSGAYCGAGTDGRGMIIEGVALVDHNYVQGPGHDGIDLGDSWNNNVGKANPQISNNILADTNSGIGHNNALELEGPNTSGLFQWSNTSWLNNTVFNAGKAVNGNGGDGILISSGADSGTSTAENNIIHTAQTAAGLSGVTADHNMCFNSGGTCLGTGSTNSTDPQFLSTAAPYIDLNFQLNPASAAKGAGVNLFATFTNDYFGNTRPNGPFTIGAQELQAAGAPGAVLPAGFFAKYVPHLNRPKPVPAAMLAAPAQPWKDYVERGDRRLD